MIFLYILLAILGIIAVLFLICLLRTLANKSTPAKTATVDLPYDARAEQYGEALGKMIRHETVSSRLDSDRTKFYKFHELFAEMYPNIHRVCEKHEFDGSLLFKWSGKGQGEPVLFLSHQDVVEASGEWQHPPFSGDLVDGVVWGRGTVDTKGNLFCFLQAAEELIAAGYTPPCDVYLASSCTEEHSGDGAPRTVAYLKQQGVHLRFTLDEGGMIVSNPLPGLTGTYAMIGVLEKGYGDLKFTATSTGGHASAPGKNTPLVRLGKLMADCEKHEPFTAKFNPTVEEMFRRLAPNMGFGMKFLFSNLWLFRPLLCKLLPVVAPAAAAMIKTTLAFTTAKGSNGYNVLPQEAYVTANLRFIHHQPNAESIEIMRERAAKFNIETEVLYQDQPCPVVDFKGEAFRLIERTVEEIYPGVGISPYIMTGGTDSKFYKEVCENSIRFAPLYINDQQYKSVHGVDENIYAAALTKGVDFFKSVMQNL